MKFSFVPVQEHLYTASIVHKTVLICFSSVAGYIELGTCRVLALSHLHSYAIDESVDIAVQRLQLELEQLSCVIRSVVFIVRVRESKE